MRWSCCIGEHLPVLQLAETFTGHPFWTARFQSDVRFVGWYAKTCLCALGASPIALNMG